MKEKLLNINGIPAVIYGMPVNRCYLCIHGKMGCKEEAAEFAKIAEKNGWQVLAIDLPEHGERKPETGRLNPWCVVPEHGERKPETGRLNPWCVVPELKEILVYMKQNWSELALYACSIGAWFAMQSFTGNEFKISMFVSPIVDMTQLIQNMMTWSGVTKERLEKEQIIPTDFGEDLSWKYYQYAKAHPIDCWKCKTFVLYGEKDHMTDKATAEKFCEKFDAELTVMENGEHWFHTTEQIEFLQQWEKTCQER